MDSRKGLTAKANLKTTRSLKSKSSIKTGAKSSLSPSKKPKLKSVSQLKKEADKYFSLYVRYRDGKKIKGEWYSQCITSGQWMPLKAAQAGHFMSRRYNSTRYEEENVNAQSYRDNVLFYGEQYKYALAVDLKYGDGTAAKLAKMAKVPHQFTREELLQIIHDAKEGIAFYERST